MEEIAFNKASVEASDDFQGRQKEEDLPNLVFLLHSICGGDGLRVYALHTGGDGEGGLIIKRLFDFDSSWPYSTDFLASGSNLCTVGGRSFNEETKKWPRQFLMWDLKNWRDRDEDDFKCEKGPDTVGAKPYPCLFGLDGCIYALAGLTEFRAEDVPDPAFEVYKGGSWKPLLPPPFSDYYKLEKHSCYINHKLVGRTFYVVLGGWEVYSYHVDNGIWKTIRSQKTIWKTIIPDSDHVVDNMLTYCNWKRIPYDDIDDNMVLFSCSDTIDMLACDFKENAMITSAAAAAAAAEEEDDIQMMVESDSSDTQSLSYLDERSASDFENVDINPDLYESCPSDNSTLSPECLSCDDDIPEVVEVTYPYLRVTGLEEITSQVDRDRYSTSGFVAHLAGNIYCAVYVCYKKTDGCRSILACKFEVTKQSGAADDILDQGEHGLQAKVLSSTHFPTEFNWRLHSQGFKIRV